MHHHNIIQQAMDVDEAVVLVVDCHCLHASRPLPVWQMCSFQCAYTADLSLKAAVWRVSGLQLGHDAGVLANKYLHEDAKPSKCFAVNKVDCVTVSPCTVNYVKVTGTATDQFFQGHSFWTEKSSNGFLEKGPFFLAPPPGDVMPEPVEV